MTTQAHVAATAARKAVYGKVERQIQAFETQVDTLKARAESAKADVELKAIANLETAKRTLDEKVVALKRAGETAFEQVRTDVETRVAEFDKLLHAIASSINAR